MRGSVLTPLFQDTVTVCTLVTTTSFHHHRTCLVLRLHHPRVHCCLSLQCKTARCQSDCYCRRQPQTTANSCMCWIRSPTRAQCSILQRRRALPPGSVPTPDICMRALAALPAPVASAAAAARAVATRQLLPQQLSWRLQSTSEAKAAHWKLNCG